MKVVADIYILVAYEMCMEQIKQIQEQIKVVGAIYILVGSSMNACSKT